jgi:hydrogenase maturation protease
MQNPTILPKILVIGYGNTLRGDDGVGYLVAETVAEWQVPSLRSLAVHQLLPELAEAMAEVDTVIFVDAIRVSDPSSAKIAFERLSTEEDATIRTHRFSPQSLLRLSQRLYDANSVAYLLTIPAIDFTLGNPLSAIACLGKDAALDYLKSFLDCTVPELCMKSVYSKIP